MFGGAFSSARRGVRAAQHALEPLGFLKKGEAPFDALDVHGCFSASLFYF